MLKKTLITFTPSFLLLFGNHPVASATATVTKAQLKQDTPESQPARRPVLCSNSATEGGSLNEGGTGILQKMIVESGSVTMDLDLNGLNPEGFRGSLVARPITLQFTIGANSFLPILVFNDLLRGAEPGSMALIPWHRHLADGKDWLEAKATLSILPVAISASLKQLVVEKLPLDQRFDLAVRDSKTGVHVF